MATPLDTQTITHGIELALAPVFLLTAVSGMIAAVAGRLARIIDRARKVHDWIEDRPQSLIEKRGIQELAILRKRARLANACIALLTLCGLLIGLTILLLFISETSNIQSVRTAVACFMSGVVCFLLALLCFLTETFIATHTLNFQPPKHTPE